MKRDDKDNVIYIFNTRCGGNYDHRSKLKIDPAGHPYGGKKGRGTPLTTSWVILSPRSSK